MALEVIKAAVDANTTYNNKVDVWSLGLTFAELLTGRLHEVNFRDEKEYPIPQQEGVRKDLTDLCSSMITKDTDKRLFLHQILAKELFQRELLKLEQLLPPDQLLFTKDNRPKDKESESTCVNLLRHFQLDAQLQPGQSIFDLLNTRLRDYKDNQEAAISTLNALNSEAQQKIQQLETDLEAQKSAFYTQLLTEKENAALQISQMSKIHAEEF